MTRCQYDAEPGYTCPSEAEPGTKYCVGHRIEMSFDPPWRTKLADWIEEWAHDEYLFPALVVVASLAVLVVFW